MPFLKRDQLVEKIYNAKFKKEPANFKKLTAAEIAKINKQGSASGLMSQQEKGIAPANALPYELYADGRLSDDKTKFEINLQAQNKIFGDRAAGSPFNVYAPGKYLSIASENGAPKVFEPVRTWHYAVKAGDELQEEWPLNNFENSNYHLRVYGPNGFLREFQGTKNDPDISIECGYQSSRLSKKTLTGNIELKISNLNAGKPLDIKITDNAYKQNPVYKKINTGEEIIVLNLKPSYGWYDFSIAVKGNPYFSRRFAGRVETGKETFTDPFMGRMIV
jgi:phospholipase C